MMYNKKSCLPVCIMDLLFYTGSNSQLKTQGANMHSTKVDKGDFKSFYQVISLSKCAGTPNFKAKTHQTLSYSILFLIR